MKKIISLAMVMCLALPSMMSAQDEFSNKKFYIGGSIGFQQNSYDGKATDAIINFAPEFGYNINDRMSVGLVLDYGRKTYKNVWTDDDGDSRDATNWEATITPYFRFAFFRNERVKIFADAGFSYLLGNDQVDSDGDAYVGYDEKTGEPYIKDNKFNGFKIGIRPGISYQISSKFSLVAHLGWLGYNTWKYDYEGAKSFSTFTFNIFNDADFGVYFHF